MSTKTRPSPPLVASTVHPSPLGILTAQWTVGGLWRLQWAAGDEAASNATPSGDVSRAAHGAGSTPAAESFGDTLAAYFETGDGRLFDSVPVDSTGWTPFFAAVYRACRKIPSGETIRYAELADRAGRPAAVRAAGQAMARNRVPLVIPCHRVVSRQGLRGFSAPGGLDTKQWLLDLEASQYETVSLTPS